MWYSDNHAKSARATSALAYSLESYGEMLWMLSIPGFLIGLVVFMVLGFTIHWGFWWIPVVPVVVAIVAIFMRGHAEGMLNEIGYRYDYESDQGYLYDKPL